MYYGVAGITVRVAEVARIDARGNQTRDALAKDRYRGRGDKASHRLKPLKERWMELRFWTLPPPTATVLEDPNLYKLIGWWALGSLHNFLVNIFSAFCKLP